MYNAWHNDLSNETEGRSFGRLVPAVQNHDHEFTISTGEVVLHVLLSEQLACTGNIVVEGGFQGLGGVTSQHASLCMRWCVTGVLPAPLSMVGFKS